MATLTINPVLLEVGLPAVVAGAALGALVTWLVLRRRRRNLEQSLSELAARVKEQDELRRERDAVLEAANHRLAASFSELANQSLRANSETFLRLAEQNLNTQQERAKRELGEREKAVENLVRPIREALQHASRQIGELEKARSEAYGGIRSQLEAMQLNQKALAEETQNLVRALRRPEVRGRWGELTLRRLVELAGMVEHCDFQEQVHSAGDDGVIRPDMIVRMPDRRELIVDVKTPLDAYLEAVEARTDAQRDLCLKRHARNLREHIRKLASKTYWDQFADSPEFVILFIPGDQFLSAALNQDPDLIETALSQQIILATPTSFVALLKAVAYGWRQLALAENAEEIRRLAEDLHGRLGTFAGHLNMVGKNLARSVENYNRAVGSLERSVLPGARKFVELGIRPKKAIDPVEPLDSLPRTVMDDMSESAEDSPHRAATEDASESTEDSPNPAVTEDASESTEDSPNPAVTEDASESTADSPARPVTDDAPEEGEESPPATSDGGSGRTTSTG